MQLGVHYAYFSHTDWEHRLVDRLTETARVADQGGIAQLTLMDHWFQMEMLGGPPEPMLEGYTTLGYLAGQTSEDVDAALGKGQFGMSEEQVEMVRLAFDRWNSGDREIRYSLVTAMDRTLLLSNVSGPPPIVLNDWAARDLRASVGDIVTLDEYGDFEFKADVRLSKGANSGIKFFVQPGLSPIDKKTGQPTAIGSALGLMTSAEAPDPLTFVVHWSAPYVRANEAPGLIPMARHLLEDHQSGALAAG